MKDISVIKNSATLVILEDIKKEITAALGAELKEIILYGSYARNRNDKDSDMDIIVFIDREAIDMAEIREKLSDIKVDLSLKYNVVISIIVKNYKQYKKHREIVPFYSNIYSEGVEIYG